MSKYKLIIEYYQKGAGGGSEGSPQGHLLQGVGRGQG